MENANFAESKTNIELSIQLINDISVYAKRATVITLHTAGVIDASITEMQYAQLKKKVEGDEPSESYLNKIAKIIDVFCEKVDRAVLCENAWLRIVEILSGNKCFEKFFKKWKLSLWITEIKLTTFFEWYKFRIDLISKAYLNQMIDQIQFMEVKDGEQ